MVYLVLFLIQVIVLYFLSRKIAKNLSRLIYRVTKSEKWTTWLMAILFLPGTFIHEMTHFLTALLLFVPVGQPEFLPERQGRLTKLGSVPIGKSDPFRRTIIGVAPFVFGIAAIVFGLDFLLKKQLLNNVWIVLAAGYGIFEIGNTMFSSREDLKSAWIVALVLAIVGLAAYFLGIRLTFEPNIELVKKANLFLLIPIGIDLIVVYLANGKKEG